MAISVVESALNALAEHPVIALLVVVALVGTLVLGGLEQLTLLLRFANLLAEHLTIRMNEVRKAWQLLALSTTKLRSELSEPLEIRPRPSAELVGAPSVSREIDNGNTSADDTAA
jgi:hypothetical protein